MTKLTFPFNGVYRVYFSQYCGEKREEKFKIIVAQAGELIELDEDQFFIHADLIGAPEKMKYEKPIIKPRKLHQDPKQFRGHIKGCHAWRWENYNRCSCYHFFDLVCEKDGEDCLKEQIMTDRRAREFKSSRVICSSWNYPFVPSIDLDWD